MRALCWLFGHSMTGWAPALVGLRDVRGCTRCDEREYADMERCGNCGCPLFHNCHAPIFGCNGWLPTGERWAGEGQ